MFKFVVLAAIVATSQAGVLLGGTSFASSPALGAPLLGRVSYNAPEVNIVKQQVVVDQPEVRYRSVPHIVQTAPIVKTTVAQPVIQQVVQPVVQQAVVAQPLVAQQVVAQPLVAQQAVVAPQAVVAQPALTYSAGLTGLGYNGLAFNGLGLNGFGLNGLGYSTLGGLNGVTLLKK